MTRAQANVGVTVAPLGAPADAVAWVAAQGIRGIQWSATQAGMRPRELGESARRDIRALLARHELGCSGIDAMVPPAHLVDPQHAERAIDAIRAACELAADLGRAPVTVQLPDLPPEADARAGRARDEAIAAIVAAAERTGVAVADLGGAVGAPWPPVGVAIDPAAVLAGGGDPSAEAMRAGRRLRAARIVDLHRTGMRAPVGVGGASRLDPLAYRVALETAGFDGLPVIDCRQWDDPRGGVVDSLASWVAAIG